MRRTISIIITVFALMISQTASSQIRFGIKGGLNMTKASFKSSDFTSDNTAGFFIGPTLEVKFPVVGLGVDASLLYDNLKMKTIDANGITDTRTFNGVDLPINASWTFGTKFFGVYVATGPQFSWNLEGQNSKTVFSTSTYKFKSSVFSWNVGGGFYFAKHFRLAYTYNIGVGPTANVESSKVQDAIKENNIKNNTHQFHLTYFFK
ncbi:MAG: PorT family protein [Bacteroidaceae bacterium]|nr:PorT family protein [Bacteroidaceae bacterium]